MKKERCKISKPENLHMRGDSDPDAKTNSAPTDAYVDEDSVDETVKLICSAYKTSPPTSKEGDENACRVWQLLRRIEECPNILCERNLRDLRSVKWFPAFFGPVMISHITSDGFGLSYGEVLKLLKETCPNTPPKDDHAFFASRSDGQPVLFVPQKALERIAEKWSKHDGLSEVDKTLFENLIPWGRDWIVRSMGTEKQGKRVAARSVSSANKIDIIKLFHCTSKPTSKDCYPIEVDNGSVYLFKPSSWLGDIANNFLPGDRSRVRLSASEMKELEGIPWFTDWIGHLGEQRKRRNAKGCKKGAAHKIDSAIRKNA